MLKVKRPIVPNNTNSGIEQWQNDIKNLIKTFYLEQKKDRELIEKYEKTFQTLKSEYTIIYKRNEELENKLKEYENKEKYKTKFNETKDHFQDLNMKMTMTLKMFNILSEKKEEHLKKLFMKKKVKMMMMK